MTEFQHEALEADQMPMDKLVYTAMSKKFFYMRLFVTKHALEHGVVPLNPFTTFDYFLLDTVDRNIVRKGNNTLVQRADEIWTYGDISDGVLAEMIQAKRLGRPVVHFVLDANKQFMDVPPAGLTFEDEIAEQKAKFIAGDL